MFSTSNAFSIFIERSQRQISITKSHLVKLLPLKKYFMQPIKNMLFTQLLHNVLLSPTCDNLLMQMVMIHRESHEIIYWSVNSDFPCLKIWNCDQPCIHPLMKRQRRKDEKSSWALLEGTSPSLPWSSRLSVIQVEHGVIDGTSHRLFYSRLSSCPFSSCTDFFTQYSTRCCSLDQSTDVERLMASHTDTNTHLHSPKREVLLHPILFNQRLNSYINQCIHTTLPLYMMCVPFKVSASVYCKIAQRNYNVLSFFPVMALICCYMALSAQSIFSTWSWIWTVVLMDEGCLWACLCLCGCENYATKIPKSVWHLTLFHITAFSFPSLQPVVSSVRTVFWVK